MKSALYSRIALNSVFLFLTAFYLLRPGLKYFTYDPDLETEKFKMYVMTGVIVDTVLVKKYDPDNNDKGNSGDLTIDLQLRYTVSGDIEISNHLELEITESNTDSMFHLVTKKEHWANYSVYYDPEKPEKIITTEEHKHFTSGAIANTLSNMILTLLIMGLILAGVFVYLIVKQIRKLKSSSTETER